MALAWTFGPEKRPKFVDLLPKLEILRSKQYLQVIFIQILVSFKLFFRQQSRSRGQL